MTPHPTPSAIDLDADIDRALDGPLLQVPDDFSARVLAALPARPVGAEPPGATGRPPARLWRLVQALVLAACGALGAVEVLLFVGGLWTATAVAVG
ncbi:hypothetical protein [Ideonella sp. A 288]|uniref:hypothetical protein n=1 Tax=Ideonella sp. A 288 TaxID=1962181 RepID=UPI000B4BD63E|nr:hypothetical protein [Ideonella sp. A 288]